MLIDLPKTRKRSGRPLTDTQVHGVHNREALMNSQLIYSNNDLIADHSTGVKWTRKLDICWRECEWRVPEKTPRADARVFGGVFSLLLVLRCSYCRCLHTESTQKITSSSLHEFIISRYSKYVNAVQQ